MGWLIAAGVLAAVWFLPLIIRATYDSRGLRIVRLIGPVEVPVYPPKAPGKKHDRKHEGKSQKKKRTESFGSVSQLRPILQRLLTFFHGLRRRFVVSRLDAIIIMANDDPCDLAVNYGCAWAALGELLPLLESTFNVKKRNIKIQCDFTASETKIDARADLLITFGRLLIIACKEGIPLLKEYFELKNQRKGGN